VTDYPGKGEEPEVKWTILERVIWP